MKNLGVVLSAGVAVSAMAGTLWPTGAAARDFTALGIPFAGTIQEVTIFAGFSVGDINGDQVDDVSWTGYEGQLFYVLGIRCDKDSVGEYDAFTQRYCRAEEETFAYPRLDDHYLYENDLMTKDNFCRVQGYERSSASVRVLGGGTHIVIYGDFSTSLRAASGWTVASLTCQRNYHWSPN